MAEDKQDEHETLSDVDDHVNDTTANRNVTSTNVQNDVSETEVIASTNATALGFQNQQTIAENQQRLTLQAQLNNSYASLAASVAASMAQAVLNATSIAQSSENQKQRCVDHSEEAQHKTIQATIPVGGH